MFNSIGCHTTVTLRGVTSTCPVTFIFQMSVMQKHTTVRHANVSAFRKDNLSANSWN